MRDANQTSGVNHTSELTKVYSAVRTTEPRNVILMFTGERLLNRFEVLKGQLLWVAAIDQSYITHVVFDQIAVNTRHSVRGKKQVALTEVNREVLCRQILESLHTRRKNCFGHITCFIEA